MSGADPPGPARGGARDPARSPYAGLGEIVERARQGDAGALEAVARAVRRDVHRLALRMLGCPHDAADASQEILLKVVTRLGAFEGRSSFRTWVWRVAMNHLLDFRASRLEAEAPTFEAFGDELAQGLADPAAEDPQQAILLQELRVGCTQAMLVCLDRDHRAAYVLGEILELDGREAAEVLGIAEPALRKRLSRARRRIVEFMSAHCGLVGEAAACRCVRRLPQAIAQGRVDPSRLLFARPGASAEDPRELVAELSALQRVVAVYRGNPLPDAEGPVDALRALLDAGALRSLA